jgi:hypothetical protein
MIFPDAKWNSCVHILYVDFIEIIPTKKHLLFLQDDINLLMDNYDNIAMWKEKFPQEAGF